MRNEHNRFKLFRALTLKEYGYFDEAFEMMTEVIFSEVDGLDVKEIKEAKKDSKYVDAVKYYDEFHLDKWYWRKPASSGPASSDVAKRYSVGFS
jgi:hypothetical protein